MTLYATLRNKKTIKQHQQLLLFHNLSQRHGEAELTWVTSLIPSYQNINRV